VSVPATGPLNGVKVIDLTHVWAGPLATRIVADLGADVVKVESPLGRGPADLPPAGTGIFIGGEHGGEPWNRQGVFSKLNRNKRSVCLDLKHDDARAVFLDLVRVADVLIENFSARAMRSLSLDWPVLKETNPRLIYVAMPGFGMDGPYSANVAFGPSVEPMSGWGSMIGYGAGEPRNTSIALLDAISGTSAAAALTTALNRRKVTGRGMLVELSLHESGSSFTGEAIVDHQLGNPPIPTGNQHPAHVFSDVIPAAGTDEWVAVSCRTAEQAASYESLRPTLAGMSKHEMTERLQAAGIAAGPVNAAPDLFADPHLAARQFFVSLQHAGQPSCDYPGSPITFDHGANGSSWQPSPNLGEHNAEVLREWLSYPDERIEQLQASLALRTTPPGADT
jgi:crotonobetainyl-CoA:carnitine CoA-transferase CaiB-like acyl-CoA transferase